MRFEPTPQRPAVRSLCYAVTCVAISIGLIFSAGAPASAAICQYTPVYISSTLTPGQSTQSAFYGTAAVVGVEFNRDSSSNPHSQIAGMYWVSPIEYATLYNDTGSTQTMAGWFLLNSVC